jgi:hypothetical protein
MSTRSRLLSSLSRALDGLACADLGEYLPQREKEAILGVTGVRPPLKAPAPAPTRPARRVALAVQGRLQGGALRYAQNACERLDADLDVLTNLADDRLHAAVASARQDLEPGGHRVEVVHLGGDVLKGIVHYARERHGLLFVVVSAADAFTDTVVAGHGTGRRLDVPWVVVAGADAA